MTDKTVKKKVAHKYERVLILTKKIDDSLKTAGILNFIVNLVTSHKISLTCMHLVDFIKKRIKNFGRTKNRERHRKVRFALVSSPTGSEQRKKRRGRDCEEEKEK